MIWNQRSNDLYGYWDSQSDDPACKTFFDKPQWEVRWPNKLVSASNMVFVPRDALQEDRLKG